MTRPILLVEDDFDVRTVVSDLLASEGYAVVAAENGRVALDRVRALEQPPGLILLDLMMPVMDGLTFLQVFRSEFPALASVPVLVVSAAHALKQQLPGNVSFMPKPIGIEELLAFVRTHCGPAAR